jgi:hypothetical protein
VEGRVAIRTKKAKDCVHSKVNVELVLFNLGNNADHASLRMFVPMNDVVALPINTTNVIGELITPTQVVAKEMVIVSNGKNDDEGDKYSFFS